MMGGFLAVASRAANIHDTKSGSQGFPKMSVKRSFAAMKVTEVFRRSYKGVKGHEVRPSP
jgi:hypothetical protein